MSNDLQQAIAAIKAGDKETGQQLLMKVIKADPKNEAAWLWMASTLDDPQEKKECLQKVLQINPGNEMAKKALVAFERPGELAELPRFADISPKPAQKTAPSMGLAGSRMWRPSLFALGGVAVLLVLYIGAMLVVSSLVGRDALVSMFSHSNPLAEQASLETAVPTAESEQVVESYPPTWTPAAPRPTSTPAPVESTSTRKPTSQHPPQLVVGTTLRFLEFWHDVPMEGVVTHFERRESLYCTRWDRTVYPQGVWFVVLMDVTNHGQVSGCVGNQSLKVKDSDGREFDMAELDAMWAAETEYGRGNALEDIQPGFTAELSFVFDVLPTSEGLHLISVDPW